MKKIGMITLALMIGFGLGALALGLVRPKMVEYPVYYPAALPVYYETVITETVVEEVFVERLTEIEIVVEKPIYNVDQRFFDSLDELKEWRRNYEVPELAEGDDCEDYALYMMRQALRDGYLVSTEIIESDEHITCSTFIGNEIFFISPTSPIIDRLLGGRYWILDNVN